MSETPLVSIVIPSRNNRQRLEETLASIARSDFDLQRLEVIVADDGSTDGTAEALRGRPWPYALRLERGAWANQSAATNAAIRRARGTYILASASDIVFDPSLIARHLHWHEAHTRERLVVLGALPYDERLDVTPFMFYLVHGGFQFAYHQIRDPQRVPPNFLYAPNFSVRRDLLLEVGAFDERFPFGCQDTDLGIRLARAGARMVYDPWALGYHNHPVTLESYLRRQELAGRAMVLLEDKHPDFEGGPASLDMALTAYLVYAETDADRDAARIAELEPLVRARPEYRELWVRALSEGRVPEHLDEEARALLAQTERLFRAYHRILSFYWGRGYLEAFREHHGREVAGRRIGARLHKYQLSSPAWRTARKRLSELELSPELARVPRAPVRLVVYGTRDYREAVDCLAPFQDPPGAVCGVEVAFVCAPDSFRTEEVERLQGVADVVVAPSEEGIMEALSASSPRLSIVLRAGLAPPGRRQVLVAERLFERLPRVGALCPGSGLDSQAGPSPLAAPAGGACWLRAEVVAALRAAGAKRWPEDFQRLAAREGWTILAVPDLSAEALPAPHRMLEPA